MRWLALLVVLFVLMIATVERWPLVSFGLALLLLPMTSIIFLSHIFRIEEKRRKLKEINFSLRRCPDCGAKLKKGDLICRNCYQNIVENCPQCGEIVVKQVGSNYIVCPECGKVELEAIDIRV